MTTSINGLGSKVPKSLFDANSIIIAIIDNVPVVLSVPASTVVGRKASGDVTVLTDAELATLLATQLNGTYVGLADALTSSVLTNGEGNWWRPSISASASLPNQTLRLVYFTARKTETITKLVMTSSTTAAGATPTLVRFGIYSVAGNGDLALIHAIANDTGIFVSTGTEYERALTSSFSKVQGTRYAVASLVVTGATAPTVIGQTSPNGLGWGVEPRLVGAVTGQTDLPASISAGSIVNSSIAPYTELRP